MDNFWKTFTGAMLAMLAWAAATLLIFGLVGCGTKRPRPERPVPVVIQNIPDSLGYIAATGCKDGQPVIVVDSAHARVAEARYTLVHEMRHARNMLEMGCDKYLKRYNSDKMFRLREEVEAECASLASMRLMDEQYRAGVDRIIRITHHHFPVSYGWLVGHVELTCDNEVRRLRQWPP